MAGFRDARAARAKRSGWCRSGLPYAIVFILFAGLLGSLGLLAHFRSPARRQQLGWQSWDLVQDNTDGKGDVNEALSLPLDTWDPLLPHTTGLTEITVSSCYLPPTLFPSLCKPKSSGADDKLKGKWVMVEKDLNIRTGIWYLNLYYRRTHRLDAPVVSDIRVAPHPLPAELKSELSGWILADGDLRSGVWPRQSELRLYYTLQAARDEDIITELDVLYGDDDAFYGFNRVKGGPVVQAEGSRWETVDIAYRRGTYAPPKAHRPRFHKDGTFKVMQIADLHYSVGKGECRDVTGDCDGDAETAQWLSTALDAEKPDLVVFSGDQLNGQKTSYDARSVLAKFAAPVIQREIPWTAIFGNHDSEINEDREHQMSIMMQMPYSLAKAGPANVHGVGNYVVKMYSGDDSRMHLFTLYFLDSGSYQGRSLPWEQHKYDYLRESQIEWYHNVSSHIAPISRPFRPDGASDLDKIWPRRQSRRDSHLAKPNAMMFFHIPLQEAYSDPDVDDDGQELDVGSIYDIGSGASETNGGMLENGILSETERSEVLGGYRDHEVKVLSHGHCHLTDRCRRVRGVWMCFDGGSSFSGYGLPEFERRVRVYEISEWGEKVETFKRLVSGETVDRQVLVEPR